MAVTELAITDRRLTEGSQNKNKGQCLIAWRGQDKGRG